LRLLVFDKQTISGRQTEPAAMSRNIDQEIAAMREEIKDLEKAIARQDPPLAPSTRAIAEAKIATLQGHITAMMRENGHQHALSEEPKPS
jgi:hypothetical protein